MANEENKEIETLSIGILSNLGTKKEDNSYDKKSVKPKIINLVERAKQERMNFGRDKQYQSPIVKHTREYIRKTEEIVNAVSSKVQAPHPIRYDNDLKHHMPFGPTSVANSSESVAPDDVKVRIVDNYNLVGKSKYDIIPNYFSYDPAGPLSPMHKEYLAANQTLLHTFYKKVERYTHADGPIYGKVLKELGIAYTQDQNELNRLYSNKGLIQVKKLEQNEIYTIFAKMIKHAKEVRAEKLSERTPDNVKKIGYADAA